MGLGLKRLAVLGALAACAGGSAWACSILCPTAERALGAPTVVLLSGDPSAVAPTFTDGVLTYGGEGALLGVALADGTTLDSLGRVTP